MYKKLLLILGLVASTGATLFWWINKTESFTSKGKISFNPEEQARIKKAREYEKKMSLLPRITKEDREKLVIE